jgi:hypothetical protein
MFDPRNGGYWLIGPNRETGDTFYLCRECTHFMEETPQTPRAPAQCIDEEEGEDYAYDSDFDLDNRENFYDHNEECS